MEVNEFLNIICPNHGRTSCNDDDLNNGFYSYIGHESWHGRCTRCILLQIINGEEIPEDFDPEGLYLE